MKTARLPSNVVPCRPEHIVYLVQHMREDERAQFIALSGLDEFNEDAAVRWFIDAAFQSGLFAITVLQDDNLPAAAGGFQPAGTGVRQAWMLGTADGWSQQWRSLTKATCWLIDRIFEGDHHRVQTSAITSRERAIEWFERSLGFKPEGVWRHYGIRGEDIAHFSRLRGE